ncbi:2-keto-4-pentenoate hydratase (plasmid) [Vibrio nigripulchritudo]|uniref:2-hydroxypent-2,4-dienoate hydratase n=1 Tax=Vibrio nigripulchritudo SOn1 TaxID=1238450 RepID=A0AAV2VQ36_9VIBR|nr:2-oxopent-4-enoate hydratase [Vibrio nigripulchritudo]BCL73730.1 2-keto-4-pentenoate hydratase [Vibrio nigripulchritudo]BDU35105.1 2-keto-4-pentenoate hydratase [Vibrio nigripulchritudo]CCO46759.1 2-hydroxypent-2,4-dienoate hydratase [Vibrio nigripulchritudo SOn1]
MEQHQIIECSDEIYRAMRELKPIAPLTERFSDMSIEDAYNISKNLLDKRLSSGEKLIGKKIGVTSKAVQNMLNVYQPDFGFLTDKMAFSQGEDVPITDSLIQPKAEGEIAFVLKRDLRGPGVTVADVIAATEFVMPCFEVVDSRIKDWKIKIEDTIADNASCGAFLLGGQAVDPKRVDLATCGMVIEKNGKVISTGAGAAALGSPANCVAWLANTLGELGMSLKAGEVILSGALVPLEPVSAGDFMQVKIGGVGCASVRFI